jgi:hypothetical protein
MGKRELQVFHVSCFAQFIKTVLVQSTTKGNARIRSERRHCDLVECFFIDARLNFQSLEINFEM